MKIYRTSSCKETEQLAGAYTEERLIVCVTEKPCVFTGRSHALNQKACDLRGLEVGRGEYLGGSIVCMPGDLSLCRISWGRNDWAERVVKLFLAWLKGKVTNIETDGNDVLAAGKKVISWARATTKAGWCQSVVHFSVGPMDLDLVKAICTKPMNKIPGSLGEYGIRAEDVLAVIEPLVKGG